MQLGTLLAIDLAIIIFVALLFLRPDEPLWRGIPAAFLGAAAIGLTHYFRRSEISRARRFALKSLVCQQEAELQSSHLLAEQTELMPEPRS